MRHLLLYLKDLFVSFCNCAFNQLYEVVRLENSTVGVHFDNVHVNELFEWQLLAGDNVSNIYDTVIVVVCIVIKEDVLSLVV